MKSFDDIVLPPVDVLDLDFLSLYLHLISGGDGILVLFSSVILKRKDKESGTIQQRKFRKSLGRALI
jgi:hypothetical protein